MTSHDIIGVIEEGAGVCHAGVGCVIVGWGVSCRGGMGHVGLECIIIGWVVSCRGGMCHSGVGCVIQGWVGHAGLGWGEL